MTAHAETLWRDTRNWSHQLLQRKRISGWETGRILFFIGPFLIILHFDHMHKPNKDSPTQLPAAGSHWQIHASRSNSSCLTVNQETWEHLKPGRGQVAAFMRQEDKKAMAGSRRIAELVASLECVDGETNCRGSWAISQPPMHSLSPSVDLLNRKFSFFQSFFFFSLVGFRLCWDYPNFCFFFSLSLTVYWNNKGEGRGFFPCSAQPFLSPPSWWKFSLPPAPFPADGFCFATPGKVYWPGSSLFLGFAPLESPVRCFWEHFRLDGIG